jgi:hypothetical protein
MIYANPLKVNVGAGVNVFVARMAMCERIMMSPIKVQPPA